ncbi:unnamed protein product [Camellia sinensis]
MASMDPEIAKTQEERKKMEQRLASLTSVTFDTNLYGENNPFEGYEQSIPVNDEEENFNAMDSKVAWKLASYTAPKSILKDMPRGVDEDKSMGFKKPSRIIDRKDEYWWRRLNRVISPERHYAFGSRDKTPDVEEALKREKEDTLRLIDKKKKEEEEEERKASAGGEEKERKPAANAASQQTQKKRNRWDQSQDENNTKKVKTSQSDWDIPDSTPGIGRWDATPTPGRVGDATPSLSKRNRWDEIPTSGRLADLDATPAGGGVTPGATPAGMTWNATPKFAGLATPTLKRQRSRWDETPETMGSATPMAGATPAAAYTPGVIPVGGVELATPTPGAINLCGAITPEQYNLLRWEKDIKSPVDGSQYFGALLNEEEEEEEELTAEEQKERKIMKLLHKVKNGTPPQRKTALRQLTDKAREFGAGPLLNRILSLLMQPTLEDQERHLLEIGRPCGMTLRTF